LAVARALAVVAASGYAAAAASSAGGPGSMLSAIVAAGRAQHSVHYTVDASFGTIRVLQVSDVGRARGIQRISFAKAGKHGMVTVVVAARTAYIRGTALALTDYMGFKPAAASKYANVWVSIPATNSDYSTVAAAVTLTSAIDEIKLVGPLVQAPDTTLHGRRVSVINGAAPGTSGLASATLYARAAGPPLPVELVASAANGTRLTTKFSKWNAAVLPAVPRHAVPIARTGLQ